MASLKDPKDIEIAAKDRELSAKDREIALILEARDARERALRLEMGASQREAEQRREAEQLRRENEQLRRDAEVLKSAHARELEALRGTLGTVQGAVEQALREERARLAEQAAAARYQQDQRRLWLRSPDCVLQVLCLVAMNGHDAHGFANLSRAFRGDVVLWGCIKDRRMLKGRTALMASAQRGDLARVRWLLDRGADVNALYDGTYLWGERSKSSLMLASENGHLEVVRELLDRGANISAATNSAYTSLMLASRKGHLMVVRELLDKGSDLSARDDVDKTAFMHACEGGNLEVVRELLRRGANHVKDTLGDGWTPFMAACKAGRLKIVRDLLGRGINVNHKTNEGLNSLHASCVSGCLEIVRFLLEKGIDVNNTDESEGWTPLMEACHRQHLDIARELLDHGAHVDALTAHTAVDANRKSTALMWACSEGEMEIAQLLLARGANKMLQDENGRTAYDYTPKRYVELRALVKP